MGVRLRSTGERATGRLPPRRVSVPRSCSRPARRGVAVAALAVCVFLPVRLCAGGSPRVTGEVTEIRVAVASNFASVAAALADRFEADTGHRVVLLSGSTGKLYAQVRNGARFDAFLAADARRPELLEREGLAVPGSRFTYALGRLALWSVRAGYVDDTGRILATGDFRRLAIANPRLAPYGEAARRVLETLGLWDELEPRLVRGENVAQAYQYVATGNAELGFVAYAQLTASGASPAGSAWLVPADLHEPVEQQAVLLRDVEPARRFLAYLAGAGARGLIESHGYATP